MAHTSTRSVIFAGAALALGAAFVACGSLNDVRVNVTDAPGGAGGSSDMSSAGHAGNAASGASSGGSHATGGTSSNAEGGVAGELEAGAAGAMGLGGSGGGAGGSSGSGGSGGSGGHGGGGGAGGAAGHAGVGGAGGSGGAGGTGGAGGACNTVVQKGNLVAPTAGTGTIPALVRSAIPVGTYVLTSEVWYGRGTPVATDAYHSTVIVTTAGAATIVIQALDDTPIGEKRSTVNINTTAAPPNGVQVVCSTDPTTPLNQDVQIDYSAVGATLKLAFGTTTLDTFTKQ